MWRGTSRGASRPPSGTPPRGRKSRTSSRIGGSRAELFASRDRQGAGRAPTREIPKGPSAEGADKETAPGRSRLGQKRSHASGNNSLNAYNRGYTVGIQSEWRLHLYSTTSGVIGGVP